MTIPTSCTWIYFIVCIAKSTETAVVLCKNASAQRVLVLDHLALMSCGVVTNLLHPSETGPVRTSRREILLGQKHERTAAACFSAGVV